MPRLNIATVTDSKGNYLISNIPKGEIKIKVSFVGFNTEIFAIDVIEFENTVNFMLNEAVIETQEVVVTGGYVSSQHDNAVKIDVLNVNDITMQGFANFCEKLTQVPGVDMISKGQGVSKPVIRGLSKNDVLVMNNGVRIENYQFSENHPLGVDDNDIQRVEIIKGPASLLYGSDAIGGVINFIKDKPAPQGQIIGDYRGQFFSNSLGAANSFGLKASSKNLFGGLRVGHKTHADYMQPNNKIVPNSKFNEKSLNANIGYTGKIGTFKVFYDYFKQDLGMSVPQALKITQQRSRKNKFWFQDLQHQLLATENTIYLGKFKWTVNLAYQNALRKLITNSDVPMIEMNLNTLTYDTKLHFTSVNKYELILGVQGMMQKHRNLNSRKTMFLPDADVNNIGFIGMAQFYLSQKIKLQGGARYDIYNTSVFEMGQKETPNYYAPITKEYSNINGSVGIVYQPVNELIIRLNTAKAYRVPNLSELTAKGVHGNRYELGNSDLVPEDALEADLSLHYHSDFISFDAAVFYNHLNNYIYLAPTTEITADSMSIFRITQSNAMLYGGELGLHIHPKILKWLHLKTTFSSVIGKQDNGNYIPFVPAHKIYYEIMAQKNKLAFMYRPNIKLSATTALSQNNVSPDETPTNGYTIVNIGVYTDILVANQYIKLGLSVNNLLNKEYIDHLSTLKGLNFYNPGRNISLSLVVPFALR